METMDLTRRAFLGLAASSAAALSLTGAGRILLPDRTVRLPRPWRSIAPDELGMVLFDSAGRIVGAKKLRSQGAIDYLMDPSEPRSRFHLVFDGEELLPDRGAIAGVQVGAMIDRRMTWRTSRYSAQTEPLSYFPERSHGVHMAVDLSRSEAVTRRPTQPVRRS